MLRIVPGEMIKIAVSLSRMVELADGTGHLGQCIQIRFRCGHALLVPGLPSGRSEGIDMAQGKFLLPGHFIAENAHKGFVRYGCRSRFSRSPFCADSRAVLIYRTGLCVVKGIAVVGQRKKVQMFCSISMGKGLFCRSGSVRNLRVGMELTEIEVPVFHAGRHLLFRSPGRGQNGVRIKYSVQKHAPGIHPVPVLHTLRQLTIQSIGASHLGKTPLVQHGVPHQNPQIAPVLIQAAFHCRHRAFSGFCKVFHQEAAAAASCYRYKISRCQPRFCGKSQADAAGIILQNRLVSCRKDHNTFHPDIFRTNLQRQNLCHRPYRRNGRTCIRFFCCFRLLRGFRFCRFFCLPGIFRFFGNLCFFRFLRNFCHFRCLSCFRNRAFLRIFFLRPHRQHRLHQTQHQYRRQNPFAYRIHISLHPSEK